MRPSRRDPRVSKSSLKSPRSETMTRADPGPTAPGEALRSPLPFHVVVTGDDQAGDPLGRDECAEAACGKRCRRRDPGSGGDYREHGLDPLPDEERSRGRLSARRVRRLGRAPCVRGGRRPWPAQRDRARCGVRRGARLLSRSRRRLGRAVAGWLRGERAPGGSREGKRYCVIVRGGRPRPGRRR